jgi:hypothetical protein
MKKWAAVLLSLGLVAPAGCEQREARLLIAYTGDCQAYLDPCG